MAAYLLWKLMTKGEKFDHKDTKGEDKSKISSEDLVIGQGTR